MQMMISQRKSGHTMQKTPPGAAASRRISISEQFAHVTASSHYGRMGGASDHINVEKLLEGQKEMSEFMERMFDKINGLEAKVNELRQAGPSLTEEDIVR